MPATTNANATAESINLPLLLSENRPFHSRWQIDRAITAKNGQTLYGCYHQALREFERRWASIRQFAKQRELLALDMEELEEEIERLKQLGTVRYHGPEFYFTPPTFQPRPADHVDRSAIRAIRRKTLELQEKSFALAETKMALADAQREFLRFLGHVIACRRELGLGDDEPMGVERREELDREFWRHSLLSQCALDLTVCKVVQRPTIELIQAADPEMRAEVLDRIRKDRDKLIDWYLNYRIEMPEPVRFTVDESQRILEWATNEGLKGLMDPVESEKAPNPSFASIHFDMRSSNGRPADLVPDHGISCVRD